MSAFPYNQIVLVGRSEARKPAGSLSLMEMELWSLEPIGDKTFEEMRDSGEDSRTKSIVGSDPGGLGYNLRDKNQCRVG